MTLHPNVAISSLLLKPKIYLNLFGKLHHLKKVSKTDPKQLKSKHFEDVNIYFNPRVTVGSLSNSTIMFSSLLELYFFLKKMHENKSKQSRSKHLDESS